MSTPPPDMTYESALQELEALVRRLEEGRMPLDEMLSGYRRGNELLQFCQGRLQVVEEQIRLLQPTGTSAS